MPFKKGHEKIGGKSKGTQNKVTQDLKITIKNFVENNFEDVQKLYDDIKKDDPAKAIYFLKELVEFVVPKLARTQTDISGGVNLVTWNETKTYEAESKTNKGD
jgi:hypothetical protein